MKKRKRIILKVGDGIVLRQYAPEDAQVIFNLIDQSREHLSQNGDKTAEKYPDVGTVLDSILNPTKPKRLRMGIWDKDVFVGSVNLEPLGGEYAELGCWIGKKFIGNSYAGKASARLIRAAFKSGKTRFILADVVKTNQFSLDVLEKLGFCVSGETKKSLALTLERWIPFYIDSMFFFGTIASHAGWKKLVEDTYGGNVKRLLALKALTQQSTNHMTEFGEGIGYHGDLTLGQWMHQKKLL